MISTKLKKLVDPKNECCCESHLAHKCKEWAFEKDYKYKGEDGVVYVYHLEKLVKTIVSDKVKNWYDVSIDFQACEWIMEQTK